MPKRAAEAPPSPESHRNGPDVFGNYRSQVAELLSQDERISHHDQQASEKHCSSTIGACMSSIKKESLNVLLRKCVRNLSPEVDDMQQCVHRMNVMLQMGNKCPSSSLSILKSIVSEESGGARKEDMEVFIRSEPDLVKEATTRYSDVLLSKMENMKQQLEKILEDVVTTCRPMTRNEKRDLQKSIKELPQRNLDRIAELVGNYYVTSDKDLSNDVIVNLDKADNITLWRLHFYVGAVKNARKLIR